jgi:hypothetical protein
VHELFNNIVVNSGGGRTLLPQGEQKGFLK